MAPNKSKSIQKTVREKMIGVSKKPVRRLFTYKEEDIIRAIEDIQNKRMGFREACRFYGLPKTTVHDRLSVKISINKKPKVGPDPVLGVEGEQKLTNWVLNMAKCGFPISKTDLLQNVSNIIKKSDIKNPFKDGKPGDTWYQKFLKRHPEISLREPESINSARAAVTENRIRSWFGELRKYLQSISATEIFDDPDRIFNGDETGFSLCPKSGKVLGPRGYRNLYVIKKNNDKENIIVLVVFAASGKLCPPLVIFPYVRPPKAVVDNMPNSWVLGRSESGWMKSDVFYEYVTNEFNAWLELNHIKKLVILFIDGHKSHMTYALSEFCEANGIILYALPSNTTHILQPADVSVFKPLKQHWKNATKEWQTHNVNQVVTKVNFCSILKDILTEDLLSNAIRNGFKKCGLFPLDEDNVDYTKCVKNTQDKIRSSSSVREHNHSKVNVKDFDSASKVIALIEAELKKRDIPANIILEQINKAKANYLKTRRSKSKTPRNSASSNFSNSILTEDLINIAGTATPENLSFNVTEIHTPQLSQNVELLSINENIDIVVTNEESTKQVIDLADPGSYISLQNISVIPFDEIEISQNLNEISVPQNSITVFADIHTERNEVGYDEPTRSIFESSTDRCGDVFDKHLHYPEPTAPKDSKKRNVPKLPSAISSKAWREHYKKKDEEKENLHLEKKRKRELKSEEKERKLKEKEKKKEKKKDKDITKKKTVLQCSRCSEDLISDTEDDLEKNIGCDECVRWFHLKCTVLNNIPYAEAAVCNYKCQFC